MSATHAATIDPSIARLGHRSPALLLEHAIIPGTGTDILDKCLTREFTTYARERWLWPLLLDACAQAAGLVARDLDQAFSGQLVVVSYELTTIERLAFGGRLQILVNYKRSIANMRQLSAAAMCCDSGALRMQTLVTLAKMPTQISK